VEIKNISRRSEIFRRKERRAWMPLDRVAAGFRKLGKGTNKKTTGGWRARPWIHLAMVGEVISRVQCLPGRMVVR
jgi:hypothetical protein